MGKFREMFRPRAPVARQLQVVGLRKLYLVDLVSDAVNGPLGLGVFVLLGYVARSLAGPSVIVSITYAAIVAIIAGICYAELGSTNPKTGSSATLSLNMGGVGELVAFLVTWNLIADLAIGAGCAARGFRSTIDILTDNKTSDYFKEVAPLYSEHTSEFVDFIALCMPIVIGIACCFVREFLMTKVANTIFSFVIFLFMIIAGIFIADSSNWSIAPPDEFSPGIGAGYFLPFGMQKTFQGACILAITFVDFRKAAYPARYTESNSPLAVIIAFICTYLFLFFIGLIVTMITPYYLMVEGQEIVSGFDQLGYREGIYIVAISALLILIHAVITLTFSIAHELNSLVSEHLAFSFIGNVDIFGRKRPFYGTLAMSIIAGLLGAFFKEEQLADVISIGTLFSFGLIPCTAIIQRCRYEPHYMETCSYSQVLKQFVMCKKLDEPNYATATCVKISTALFSFLCLAGGGLIVHFGEEIESGEHWAVVTLITLAVLALYAFAIIILQPQIKSVANFKVPLFPLFNGLGILFTAYLLMSMPHKAWYRLALWSAVGFIIYAINLCTRPTVLNKQLNIGSNSDVFSLVPAKSTNSINSNSTKGSVGLEKLSAGALMREKEWKPQDLRRNGWIESEEKENDIPIIENVDTISFGSNSETAGGKNSSTVGIVKGSVPEIVITEIVKSEPQSAAPSEDQDTPEFYARKLDEIFTFDASGDGDNQSTSEEEVVEVHAAPPDVDRDTGEVSTPRTPSVRFADSDTSSEDGSVDQEEEDAVVFVAPSSPAPPPLPPASLLISPHLSAKGRVAVETPVASSSLAAPEELLEEVEEEKNPGNLNDFQLELRNTLKLRNQKMIDSIENTTLNVNEGIEIFGGKRTTSGTEEPAIVFQPAIKPGKFENHAFVEKLDSILKSQMDQADKRPRAKVYKQKRVVLVEELGLEQKAQMRLSMAELMTAKTKLRSSTGESSSLSGEINNNNLSEPGKLSPRPAPRVRKGPKSLDALSSNVNVMIIGSDN